MSEIKELKEKIKLAKELLELLEKIDELNKPRREYIPYPEPYIYPCPTYPYWRITDTDTTGDPIPKGYTIIS